MDRFFSVFQAAARCSKWNKIRLGPRFIRVSLRAPFLGHCCSHCILTISQDIDSEIRLFADDCVCYREIKGTEDTVKLQADTDRLGNWARKMGHQIPTSQMQYHADYKETDQKDQCFQ